ncbi:MAG: redoxin domain-containing protein [Deltaproteobacteria bacterium]|nr:redoxin domain-containing protein [Deltaproteobacteria bacterium]
MMKRIIIYVVAMFISLSLCHCYVFAGNTPLRAGGPLPEITLFAPKISAHQEYLGVSGSGSFKIPDIKADVVIVEIFGVTCPHCLKAAPSLNKLYETIENNPVSKGRVKLIAIGAGNDIYEIDYYRKKYKIKFPLFDDEDYSIHEQIGEPPTPYFICVKVDDDGIHRVFYTQTGGFKRSADFLDKVLEKSGLI